MVPFVVASGELFHISGLKLNFGCRCKDREHIIEKGRFSDYNSAEVNDLETCFTDCMGNNSGKSLGYGIYDRYLFSSELLESNCSCSGSFWEWCINDCSKDSGNNTECQDKATGYLLCLCNLSNQQRVMTSNTVTQAGATGGATGATAGGVGGGGRGGGGGAGIAEVTQGPTSCSQNSVPLF
jgi:hypothetical protein